MDEHPCPVLHLAMHGNALSLTGKHTLKFLEDDNTLVEPARIARCIKDGCAHEDGSQRGSVQLVVINACNGTEISSLLRNTHKVPSVISWKTAVDDEAAQTFSEDLYRALACGKGFHAALASACRQRYLRGRTAQSLARRPPRAGRMPQRAAGAGLHQLINQQFGG